MKQPTALVILDGFGYSPETKYNAIAQAKKPTLDYLLAHYPHTLLQASGSAVGLPPGAIGNSEVGHCTLGAGRIVPSAYLLLHNAIASGDFFTNPLLVEHFSYLATTQNTLHVIGLLSDAGVQSHEEIIYALLQAAIIHRIKKVVIHAILDGRDVAPKSAARYLTRLQEYMRMHQNISLGSITGRYFALDRDHNWERTCATYTMLTHKTEPRFASWQEVLAHYYSENITDEFIPPILLHSGCTINDNDAVVFTNFREDRARQLAACFVKPSMTPCSIAPLSLQFFISMIRYEQDFNNPVLLALTPVADTLKEVLSAAGKTIFSIAETEKYAHVTYFFADGREKPFAGETRILIPSLPLKKYSENPEMCAQKITDALIHSLKKDPCDFYLVNYANADMVGHTGNLPATIKAVECLDNQLEQLYYQIVTQMDGTLFITADHGNAELKYDEKIGQPHTAHTTNPVPFIWVSKETFNKQNSLHELHGLADVAPFILKQMSIPIPSEMKR